MNRSRDRLSLEILEIYRLNLMLRGHISTLDAIRYDILHRITYLNEIPEGGAGPGGSCTELLRSLQEQTRAMQQAPQFSEVTDIRRDFFLGFTEELENLESAMDDLRGVSPDDSDTRMVINERLVLPAAGKAAWYLNEFTGANSLYFSVKNTGMLAFSRRIEFYQFTLIIAALAMTLFIIIYSRRLLAPLGWLNEGVQEITRGNLSHRVPVRGNDELGALATQFNIMSGEISRHREHLEELVAERTTRLRETNEKLASVNNQLATVNEELIEARNRIEYDLNLAGNVQRIFFAPQPPITDEWDIALRFTPKDMVSGDFYDFYTAPDGSLAGLTLMDVSGHGVASGLVTMIARMIAQRVFSEHANRPVNEIIQIVNEQFISDIGDLRHYITGIMLKFSGAAVHYVNAAHTELIHRSDAATRIIKPEQPGPYKALFMGIADMRTPFRRMDFTVSPGDCLFLFSDCLNEALSPSGELYGIERIIQSVQDAPRDSAASVMDHVMRSMEMFTRGTPPGDDLTAICLIRKR